MYKLGDIAPTKGRCIGVVTYVDRVLYIFESLVAVNGRKIYTSSTDRPYSSIGRVTVS